MKKNRFILIVGAVCVLTGSIFSSSNEEWSNPLSPGPDRELEYFNACVAEKNSPGEDRETNSSVVQYRGSWSPNRGSGSPRSLRAKEVEFHEESLAKVEADFKIRREEQAGRFEISEESSSLLVDILVDLIKKKNEDQERQTAQAVRDLKKRHREIRVAELNKRLDQSRRHEEDENNDGAGCCTVQ